MKQFHRSQNSHNPTRRKLLIGCMAVVLLVVVLGALEKMHITNFIKLHKPTAVIPSGPTTEQQKQEAAVNAETKQQLVEDEKASSSVTPTSAPSTSIELSAKEEINKTVTVFTKLPGYSDGTCTLVATNGNKSTSQSAPVMFQPEFSSCAGFSIPISSVGTGTWNLQLSVTSKGATESKTIIFEVK